MSRRRRIYPRPSPTRRRIAPTAVALTAAVALTGAVHPLAGAQSAGGVDTSTALGFTTSPRPTAPPPADTSRPQILRVQPVEGRKVLADVWSPSMAKAVPTFLLLPASPSPAPLLLLLNGVGGGEDHVGWAYHTDYEDFFADKHVLVASPEGGRFSLYTDWQREDPVLGVNRWHTFLDSELPAALAGAHALNGTRGVIGVSMSGGPALTLAARSRHHYAAAASLSGFPEVSTPFGRAAMTAMVARGGGNVHNAFGPPDDPAWLAHDPSHHVERLRGTALYLASAPGNPGPHDSPEIGSATFAIGAPTELAADLGTRHMARALRDGGVPFTYDRYPSGAHTFALFTRELRDSWRVVGPALGA
ncbi:alpha/beta hydrolase [Dietzia maris]|uniref:alpha/beta hydrolase n=1 Tax=Dietzia TaxID=37914 RepID=UPI0022B42E0B|nr:MULTISPECIES: alpha/beta hydrolase family protein [Dietzia]MCZ4540182.1 alpha/beta hydrolase family protein [Dietzia maris]MCZ4656420.1 alpha/beta hydrolase family protein [Dietzia kunjamensis]MDV3356961.1 alpha/beta hydrolase family protein [Dietzia sp. IN118]